MFASTRYCVCARAGGQLCQAQPGPAAKDLPAISTRVMNNPCRRCEPAVHPAAGAGQVAKITASRRPACSRTCIKQSQPEHAFKGTYGIRHTSGDVSKATLWLGRRSVELEMYKLLCSQGREQALGCKHPTPPPLCVLEPPISCWKWHPPPLGSNQQSSPSQCFSPPTRAAFLAVYCVSQGASILLERPCTHAVSWSTAVRADL